LGHHYLEHIDAASYYSAVDAFGSPAYSVADLLRAPAGPREAADQVLARAIGMVPRPASSPAPRVSCRRMVPVPGSTAAATDVPSGGFFLRSAQTAPLILRLRRFGSDFGAFAVVLGPVAGTGAIEVAIHRDSAPVPWRLQVTGLQRPVLLCGLA
jgi:hypothetical protein